MTSKPAHPFTTSPPSLFRSLFASPAKLLMTGVKRLNYWPSGLVLMNREKLVGRQGTKAEGKGNSQEENGALSNNGLAKRFS